MNILIVFDSYVKADQIHFASLSSKDKIFLFPITSKVSLINAFLEMIKSVSYDVMLLQTADVINSSIDNLRTKYIRFIAEISNRVHCKGKNLKEYFAIDEYASLWWFSLISEKNTFKSDAFNKLAQLEAIIKVVNCEKVEKIIFGCKSNKLKEALCGFSSKKSIDFKILPSKDVGDIKKRVREFQNILYLKHILHLIYFSIYYFFISLKIKRKFAKLQRNSCQNAPLALITPYPNIDMSLAHKGIFKNKFYGKLQESLENKRQNIVWLAMYNKNNSLSFNSSLGFAEQFIKNGYNLFFIEEFCSIRIQINAFLLMLKNGKRFLAIQKKLSEIHTFGDYNFYPIFRNDWYASFVGTIGYSGLIYYGIFKSLFGKLKTGVCLYLCEMHAWEKCLIFARDASGSMITLLGYQHGTVSRMLLNYFNDAAELNDNGSYAMALPERIICNGQMSYNYLEESGWPVEKLSLAEAIRYHHLKKCMMVKFSKKKNIVLLVCSISPEESSSILNIVYESLNNMEDMEVWIKPHPFLQIENVFKLSGINPGNCSFHVKKEPIESLLAEARIVVVGESGVSIEALALGCEVVIVNVPEWINMSPLRNIKASVIRMVDSPEKIRQIVVDILKMKYNPEQHVAETRKIINDFFCFNEKSNIPEKFLQLLNSVNTRAGINLTKRYEN